MKWWFKLSVANQVFIFIIIGALAGLIFGPSIAFVKPIGDIFVSLILMMVILLIVPALIHGLLSVKDTAKIGRIGIKIIVFFLITTIIAGLGGLVLANVLGPGRGISMEAPEGFEYTPPEGDLVKVFLTIVPRNVVQALAEGNLLSILFVVLLFASALIAVSKKTNIDTLASFFEQWTTVSLKMLEWIIKLAPYGAGALIAWSVGVYGPSVIGPLVGFLGVVYLGEFLLLGLYVVIMGIFRVDPLKFFSIIKEPAMVAFATCSSMATLSLNIAATTKLGVPRGIATFGITLGNVVHMDGTALYQVISVLFISQVYNMPLPLTLQLLTVVMAALVVISLVGVPGVGTATLGIILLAVGLPLEGIGLILAVDRLADMPRTMNNNIGDALVTYISAKTEGLIGTEEDTITTET